MNDLATAIEELIDAAYGNEVDERTHDAILDVVFCFEKAMSNEDEALKRVKNLNSRVNATDGSFYFRG